MFEIFNKEFLISSKFSLCEIENSGINNKTSKNFIIQVLF